MRAKPSPINTPETTEPASRGFSIDAHRLAAPKAAPGLHLVATPIGNLGDITLRALQTLAGVDVIACEDTRITRRLTERYDISAQLKQYHEHNAEAARPKILERLSQGGSIALVSDAGTPLISDPGYKLVRAARATGHAVHTVPGPSALVAALTLAGLPTDRFLFLGFLPSKAKARGDAIAEVASVRATLVLYESGPRLGTTLTALAEQLGDREAAIAREISKLHEECVTGTLTSLADRYADVVPKGEIVVVVGPPSEAAEASDADLDAALDEALGRLSASRAAADVAASLGVPRKRAYARALERAK
jgi:16S rRNA (cytidine1402-2'-O)-methyltransferase